MAELKVPFSPPFISEEMINEVVDTLRSGWITTGPKTKLFEQRLSEFNGCQKTLCVGSATAGMELVLRWFGVGADDEVIVPSYTYCATANAVINLGARPVMVDVNEDDLCMNIELVRAAITSKTKVIVPVDLGGFPADQEALMELVNLPENRSNFNAANERQSQIGRVLIMTDAAHSLGAQIGNKTVGSITDFTVFSFHAVKNLTTAEGGAIAINVDGADDIYAQLNTKSLHGQSKDALAKTKLGQWRYDVHEIGQKSNMTDIQASLGLIQLRDYPDFLIRRAEVFAKYDAAFSDVNQFIQPVSEKQNGRSSFHFYALRIKGISEDDRSRIIGLMAEHGVATNVHYVPLPMLTAYKNLGYDIADHPIAKQAFEHVITLPVFNGITDEQVNLVISTLRSSLRKVLER